MHVALCFVLLATFLWSRAEAVCSATATPEGTYGGYSGTIMSDSDGIGRTNFGRYDDCKWRVECPAGHSFAVTDFDFDPYFSYDVLSVTDADTNVVLEKYTRGVTNANVLSKAQNVIIHFDATRRSSTDDGFTLNYACLPQQCSAETYGQWTGGTTFTSKSGLIASGTSGFYGGSSNVRSKTFEDEECSWNINCPAEMQLLSMWVRYRIASGGGVLRMGDVANCTYTSYTSSKQLPFEPVPIGGFPISYSSPSASNGYSVAYTCSSGRCSSANASVIAEPTGRIVTDFDGSGSLYKYMANEQCSWTIQCPAGSDKYLFWDVRGSLASGEHMSINRSSTGVSLFNNSASNNLYSRSNILELAAAETVSVTFSSDASSESSGFSVNYACRPTKCTSLQAGRVLTEPFGEILTDLDGHTGTSGSLNYYEAGEECMWNIQCPAEYSAGLSIVLFGKTRNDFVRITEASGREAFYGRVGSSTGSSTSQTKPIAVDVKSTGVSVSFNSTAAEPGFTLQWMCQKQPSCTSPNATAAATASSGMLMTDADGAGSQYNYVPGENCSWAISCPASANASYVRLYTSGNAGSSSSGMRLSNYGITVWANSSKVENLLPTTEYTCCRDGPVYAPTSTAFVTFTSPPQSITSPQSVGTGVSVEWNCIERKCPVDDGMVLTAMNGTIMTDRDGAGSVWEYQDGESCKWTIQCPEGSTNVLVQTLANTWACYGTNADVLEVSDPTSNSSSSRMKACNGNSADGRLFSSSRLDVSWAATSGRSEGGVTLNYQCTDSTCITGNSASVQAKYGEVGTLMSDDDGVGLDSIFNGERCTQTIVCTDGSPYIALKVQYRLAPGATLIIDNRTTTDNFGSTKTDSIVIANSSVSVTLDTTNVADGDTAFGYTITYVCRRKPCSSVTPPTQMSPAKSQYTGVVLGGTIQTDADGVGFNDYTSIEECAWLASCPAGNDFTRMFFAVEGSVGENAVWDIRNAATNAVVAKGNMSVGTASSQATSSMLAGMSARVTFNSTGPSSNGGNDGITVKFWCATSNCQSPQGGQSYLAKSYHRNYGILISSDADGQGATARSVPGEECTTRVKCYAGQRLYVIQMAASIGANQLTVYNNTNGHPFLDTSAAPTIVTFSGVRSIAGRYYLEASDVFIRYTVTEAADGFETGIRCDDNRLAEETCSAIVTRNETAGTMSFNSTDPTGGSCVEPFTCPAGLPYVRIYSDYASLGNWMLSLVGASDTIRDGLHSVCFYRRTGIYQGFLGAPGQLSWAVGGTRSSYDDYVRLNMTCVASRCTSNVSTGANVTMPTCGAPAAADCGKILATDAFQDGKGGYLSGEDCSWAMACPAGMFLHVKTRTTYPTYPVYLTTRLAHSSTETDYLLSSSFGDKGFFPSTSWGTLSAAASDTKTAGPSTTVSCRPSMCDTQEYTRTNSSDTIYFGGSSTTDYSMGAECSFLVICPAGYNAIQFIGGGSLRSSSDRIYFDKMQQLSGSSEWSILDSMYKRQSYGSYVFTDTWPYWRVRFQSHLTHSSSSISLKTKLTYSCQSVAQPSTPRPGPGPVPGPGPNPVPGPNPGPGPGPIPGPNPQPGPGPSPGAPDDGSDSSSSGNGGIIGGAVVAGFVLVGLSVLCLAAVWRRKEEEQQQQELAGSGSTPLNAEMSDVPPKDVV